MRDWRTWLLALAAIVAFFTFELWLPFFLLIGAAVALFDWLRGERKADWQYLFLLLLFYALLAVSLFIGPEQSLLLWSFLFWTFLIVVIVGVNRSRHGRGPLRRWAGERHRI